MKRKNKVQDDTKKKKVQRRRNPIPLYLLRVLFNIDKAIEDASLNTTGRYLRLCKQCNIWSFFAMAVISYWNSQPFFCIFAFQELIITTNTTEKKTLGASITYTLLVTLPVMLLLIFPPFLVLVYGEISEVALVLSGIAALQFLYFSNTYLVLFVVLSVFHTMIFTMISKDSISLLRLCAVVYACMLLVYDNKN